jgi:hypothetical protein
MAQREYHINCILKSEGQNGHEAITHIGNHRQLDFNPGSRYQMD